MKAVVCNGILILLVAGCAYHAPTLPDFEAREVVSTRIFVVVRGDDRSRSAHWGWAGALAADLEQAGFRPSLVSQESQVPAGAPYIEEYDPSGRCFSETYLLVLSLGVIPHLGCQEFGHRFSIRKSSSHVAQAVDTTFDIPVLVGWVALPLNLLPRYVIDIPWQEYAAREEAALRSAVVEALAD